VTRRATASTQPDGAPEDLILRGGTVVTMDGTRRVLVGDVHVRGREIVRVGRVVAPRGARVIDARGCAVMPGFVQTHVHLCQALFRGMADDLPLLAWLKQRIWPLEAAHDARSLHASARLGLAEMLRAGTTTILDMGTVHHHDAVFEAIAASGMRAFSGKAMMDTGEGVPRGLRETTAQSLRESDRLRARWHGAEDGRLGYAYAPRFILSCSEALLRGAAEAAHATPGVLLHSHAAEHADERRAVREALGRDDVQALAAFGITGPRTVLAHGVQLRPAEMRRLARAGTRFTHCPSANLKLASGIADVVAMREAGMLVGLGADGAPCNNRMDPFTELRQAALLAKVRRGDAAALGAGDALAMATIDGARVLGIDQLVGSIEPGKRADLAVVRLDALHTEPGGDTVARLVYACTPADVTHVLVEGRVLVDDGALRTLDLDTVRTDARREGARIRRRALG
jgi:5-methylthioadenosine/S-adenosylhomocysteine deaminase